MASEALRRLAALSSEERDIVLNSTPALAPPDDQTIPSFEDPPNSNWVVVVVMTVGLLAVTITASLRLTVVITTKDFSIVNWLGFFAYLPYIAIVFLQALLTKEVGFLVNQWDVYYIKLLDLLFYLYLYRIFYSVVMMFGKTAILLEWRRIFVPGRERTWFFWVCTLILWLNVVYYNISIILISASCIPTRRIWEPWVDGHCFDRRSNDLITAWLNLFTDLAILILPQPIIWKLHMTKQRKIGIAVIFSVGLIVVACAAGRTHSNMVLEYRGNTIYGSTVNAIWAFGETSSLLIVFGTPSIPKAFSKHTFLGGVILTLRSWTGLGSHGASNDDSRPSAHPPTIGGSGGKPRKPPRMFNITDWSLLGTKNDLESSVELQQHSSPPDGQNMAVDVMTVTRIESNREDPGSKSSMDPILELQHPWRQSRK